MKQPETIRNRELDDETQVHHVSDVPWWAAVAGLLGLLSVSVLLGGTIFLAARLAD